MSRRQRRAAENESPPPSCAMCDRPYASVFELHAVQVVAFKLLPVPVRAIDSFSPTRQNLARQLRGILRLPRVRAYLANLRAQIGKVRAPRDLLPRWNAEREQVYYRVPGAPRNPGGPSTRWELAFRTTWTATGGELEIAAVVGGHSLGSAIGPVWAHVAPLARITFDRRLDIAGEINDEFWAEQRRRERKRHG